MSTRPEGTTGLERTSIDLRRLLTYLGFFSAYCGLLLVAGTLVPPVHRWMSRHLLYMSLANTFLPLPTNPVIIWLGKSHAPFSVALIGALGTSLANLNEYYLIGYLSGRRFAGRIRERKIYERLERWYQRHPFSLLLFMNLLPVPVDPVRWLSISSGYGKLPYTSATFLGRLPRYFLLAFLGEAYQVPNWVLILIVVIPALWTGVSYVRRRKGLAGP